MTARLRIKPTPTNLLRLARARISTDAGFTRHIHAMRQAYARLGKWTDPIKAEVLAAFDRAIAETETRS